MLKEKYDFLKEAISILQPLAEIEVPKLIGLSLEKLLEIISEESYSLNRDYKISSDKSNKLIKLLIPNNPLKGVKLCTNIAQAVGFKWCSHCREYKPIEQFTKNPSKSLGVNSACGKCQTLAVSKTQPARQALYKANKLSQTPKWVDWKELQEISKFYKSCPVGYHVDHIIPLQGEKVSGLHCLSNLQYLAAEENIAKHNRYEI